MEDAINIEVKASKPNVVRYAIYLMSASLAVTVIHNLFNFKTIMDYATAEGLSFSGAAAVALFSFIFPVTVISVLIYLIKNKHNWARIFYFAVFVISIIMLISSGGQDFKQMNITGQLLSVFHYMVHISSLVLLFNSKSNAWFKSNP